jgi:hypothetical protein
MTEQPTAQSTENEARRLTLAIRERGVDWVEVRHCLLDCADALSDAEAKLAATSKIAEDAYNARHRLERELEAAEAKLREYEEAVASALTSLGTGPLRDGYAYSILDALTRSNDEEAA